MFVIWLHGLALTLFGDALPYLVALLLAGGLLGLPPHRRPAASLAAAFILLLAETRRDAEGMPLPGPSTGMAVFLLIGAGFAFFGGAWRKPEN